MTIQTIESTIQDVAPARETTRESYSARARSQCRQAVIESGSFSWRADLPPALGGSNLAPTPTSLFLSALAGSAVVLIKDTLAPRLGVTVHHVSATARCEAGDPGLFGKDGDAPAFAGISLDIHIESPDSDGVERLMEVWKQRNPVYLAMVQPTEVDVTTRVIDWYAGH